MSDRVDQKEVFERVKLQKENKELKAIVEAANKIVKKICEQCLDEKCTSGAACHICDLKKALLIPRSEVPEEVKKLTVGRVPPHVMAKTINKRKEESPINSCPKCGLFLYDCKCPKEATTQ